MADRGLADQIRAEVTANPEKAFGLILSQQLTRGAKHGELYALCPFHDDQHASWRVNPKKGQWFCDVCSIGGDAFDLVKRLRGTNFKDSVLWLSDALAINGYLNGANGKRQKSLIRTLRYDVRDLEDHLVATHIRNEFDDGSKECPWEPLGTKPTELPLYGIHDSVEYIDGDEIIVVEGEKCANALMDQGYLAVSTFGSSVIPCDESLKPLLRFKVYLWPDNDDSGRVHMRAVAASLLRLSHHHVWWMEWKGAPAKGDAADYKGDVSELFKTAVEYQPPRSKRGSVVKHTKPKSVPWLWPGYLPLGKLCDLQGDPGQGKSAVTASLAAIVSTGGVWPTGEQCEKAGVIMVSGEDDLADTIRPRLDAAEADCGAIFAFTLLDEELFELPRDLELLRETTRRMKARLVILDPLDCFVSEEIDTNKNQSIRKLMAMLARFADEEVVSVMVVRHLNKDAKTMTPMYRGGGSIGMNAASRQVFMVGPAPDDKDLHVLAHVKGNCAEAPKSLGYRLESTNLREHPDINTVKVVWTGMVEYEGWQLLQPPDVAAKKIAQGDKLNAVKQAMQDALVAGERPSSEVEQEIRRTLGNVSSGTIFNAKKALGIKARKRDFGGGWSWSLPFESSSKNQGFDSDFDSSGKW